SSGIDTEDVTVDPTAPNLLARVSGTADETFVFNGHLDTVPFDSEAWTRDPLGELVQGRIFGRGATDMKGPLGAMMVTMRAFAETGVEPPMDLAFVVVSDEEVPSDAGIEAVLQSGSIHPNACLIGETTCTNGRCSVSVADKGSIWLTLEATGVAAHGSRPMVGENAIDRLYAAIEAIRDVLHRRSLDIDEAMEPIVDESIEFYGTEFGEEAAQRLFRYPMVNLGRLEGGTSVNTVPEYATAKLDIRSTASVDVQSILSSIRDCIDRHEAVAIGSVRWSEGTFEQTDTPLVRATTAAAESVLGERPALVSATGGGDAKSTRSEGIPTVEFGVGSDTVHGVDEYISTRALFENASIYSRLPFVYANEFGTRSG
ncbi:MAG: M20 family metallopeptidase, partial [Halodesulfurarchaeum sp.]